MQKLILVFWAIFQKFIVLKLKQAPTRFVSTISGRQIHIYVEQRHNLCDLRNFFSYFFFFFIFFILFDYQVMKFLPNVSSHGVFSYLANSAVILPRITKASRENFDCI